MRIVHAALASSAAACLVSGCGLLPDPEVTATELPAGTFAAVITSPGEDLMEPLFKSGDSHLYLLNESPDKSERLTIGALEYNTIGYADPYVYFADTQNLYALGPDLKTYPHREPVDDGGEYIVASDGTGVYSTYNGAWAETHYDMPVRHIDATTDYVHDFNFKVMSHGAAECNGELYAHSTQLDESGIWKVYRAVENDEDPDGFGVLDAPDERQRSSHVGTICADNTVLSPTVITTETDQNGGAKQARLALMRTDLTTRTSEMIDVRGDAQALEEFGSRQADSYYLTASAGSRIYLFRADTKTMFSMKIDGTDFTQQWEQPARRQEDRTNELYKTQQHHLVTLEFLDQDNKKIPTVRVRDLNTGKDAIDPLEYPELAQQLEDETQIRDITLTTTLP